MLLRYINSIFQTSQIATEAGLFESGLSWLASPEGDIA